MIRILFPTFGLAVLLLTPAGCSENENPGDVRLVGHVHSGCGGKDAVRPDDPGSPRLDRYSFEDGLLVLTFVYVANCCADFDLSITTSESSIAIDLVDHGPPCNCICPYEDDFAFEGIKPGPLHVVFCLDREQSGGGVACADTVIGIPRCGTPDVSALTPIHPAGIPVTN